MTLSSEISMFFGENTNFVDPAFINLNLKITVMYILLTLSHFPCSFSMLTKATRLTYNLKFPFLSIFTPVIFELGNPFKNKLCERENYISIYLSSP